MNDSPPSSLLIALPKGYGLKRLFAEKIDLLIDRLAINYVSVLQDDNFIAEEYFATRSISVSHISISNRSFARNKISQFSHLVIFWDGEEFTDLIYQAQLQKIPVRIIAVKITKVKNKDKEQQYDIYIGRGTPWGNPFAIGLGGIGDTREDVIRKFSEYFIEEFLNDPEKHRALLSLRGYRLGCHCKPLACHGDIIAAYLNCFEG